MAKSKEQKRQEALARLTSRMEDRRQQGLGPTPSQLQEHSALSYPKRQKTELEKLFGAGDPVTGTIWADPLPWDFQPTPELNRIVENLKTRTEKFVEIQVSLDRPEGFRYATYEASGTYLNQWVSRHTSYVMHHSKQLYGSTCVVVFSLKDEVPEYSEHDELISGTTKEMYERRRHVRCNDQEDDMFFADDYIF